MVARSKAHTEDPQILGATAQKFNRPSDLVRGVCAPLAWARVRCLHKLQNAVHLCRLIHHPVHRAFSKNKPWSKALLILDGHTSHCSFPAMILNALDDVTMCVPSLQYLANCISGHYQAKAWIKHNPQWILSINWVKKKAPKDKSI
jgi:hypothetical protein